MSPGPSSPFLTSLAGPSVHSDHPEEGVLASGNMERVDYTAFLDPGPCPTGSPSVQEPGEPHPFGPSFAGDLEGAVLKLSSSTTLTGLSGTWGGSAPKNVAGQALISSAVPPKLESCFMSGHVVPTDLQGPGWKWTGPPQIWCPLNSLEP